MRPSRGWTTFASRWIVATTYVRGSRPRRASTCERSRAIGANVIARVGHDVADDLDPAGHALVSRIAARALVGAEAAARRASRPRCGSAPRASTSRRSACPPRRARADAGLRARAGARRASSSCRRRRARRRALRAERCRDPGLHRRDVAGARVQAVGGLCQAQLLEEHLRQLAVVVLPRVDDDLVDSALAQGDRQRPRLDELRAVADDGEHLHGVIVHERENPHGQRVPVVQSAVLLTDMLTRVVEDARQGVCGRRARRHRANACRSGPLCGQTRVRAPLVSFPGARRP